MQMKAKTLHNWTLFHLKGNITREYDVLVNNMDIKHIGLLIGLSEIA